jgi:hypothetical protein
MSHRQRLLRVPESLVDALNERIKEGVVDGVTYAYDDGGVLRFSLGGKTYPARLVNLPCVVESHKTLDKASYFKSGDVGQMIIVYEVRRDVHVWSVVCSFSPLQLSLHRVKRLTRPAPTCPCPKLGWRNVGPMESPPLPAILCAGNSRVPGRRKVNRFQNRR